MRDDPQVVALVARAAAGDQGAWNDIVERYAPLVWSICMRHRLSETDIEDVGQTVWLRLVEQLGHLREPAALPGWLATTTRNECLRVLRTARKPDHASQASNDMDTIPATAEIEQEVIAAERDAALRVALAELPPRCRQLLSLLVSDPPLPYSEISAILQVPVGSIGPERGRCLQRLRRSSALASYIGHEV